MNSAKTRMAGWCVALLLAACGGGGDDANGSTASRATPAGIWAGTVGESRAASGVVLEDGSYYLIYSGANDANAIGGLLEGNATLGNDSFASANGIDFNLEGLGPKAAPLSASFRGGLLPGAMRSDPAAPVVFSLDRESVSWRGARLEDIAGSFEGNVVFALGVRPATFVVTADGAVSTVINGCTISGTAAPRQDVNAFDLAIAFGGAPCVFPNAQFTGVAYRSGDGRLHAAVRHASRTQAIVFTGTKS